MIRCTTSRWQMMLTYNLPIKAPITHWGALSALNKYDGVTIKILHLDPLLHLLAAQISKTLRFYTTKIPTFQV